MKSFFSIVAIAVAMTFASSQAKAQLFWDLDGTIDGAGGATPTGMWDASTPNWNSDSTGGAFGVITPWDNTSATFSAGSDATGTYVITVDGTQSVNGITFDSGNATLTGGQLTLTGAPNTIFVEDLVTGTINSTLQGVGLTKTGTGTLVLGGDNNLVANATLTGVVTINGGTVVIPSGAPAGVLGNTVNNGNAGVLTDGNTAVNNGATLSISGTYDSPDMLFLNGDGVGGGGALRKTGNNNTVQKGAIRIRGTADHARITSTEGTLWLASTGGQSMGREFGSAARDIVFDGAGNISTTGAGTVVDSVSYSNFNISISTSRVFKEGTGTLTLNSDNAYSGGTIIRQGVVQFTADKTSGSANLGTYPAAFDADNITLDGGTLRKSTSATSATSFISTNRGVLIGPGGGGLDYTPLSGGNNASLFVQSIGEVNPGDVTTLTKYGTGEIRMSAAGQIHSFDKLVIKSGIYGIGQATTLGQDTQLGAVPTSPLADALTMDGGILRFLGGTSSTNITLDINRGVTLTTATGSAFQVEGSNVTIPGAITGPGDLTKTGALTMTLTGVNNYAETKLNAGTLVVSSPLATLGTGKVQITSGTLRITSDVTNAIADTATVDIMGGKLNLEPGINDVIASLMLGGVLQVGGTYGSTASLATFKNDTYFSGSGILTIPGGSMPGDFNNDGKVNAADYVLWRKDPASYGGPSGYDTWRANFGDPPGAGSGSGLDGGGSVPEPAAGLLVLLVIGVSAVTTRRSRR